MNGIILSCFALFALPNVLAISCYNCIPSPPSELCENPTNVTNCDDEQQMPSGTPFDACTRGSVEFKIGDVTATSNALMCGVKAFCGAFAKETFCNATRDASTIGGIQITKCDYSCCDKDKCNAGGETPTEEGVSATVATHEATSSVAATHESQATTNEPTDEGTAVASSFITTVTSLLVLLSGFFGQ